MPTAAMVFDILQDDAQSVAFWIEKVQGKRTTSKMSMAVHYAGT